MKIETANRILSDLREFAYFKTLDNAALYNALCERLEAHFNIEEDSEINSILIEMASRLPEPSEDTATNIAALQQENAELRERAERAELELQWLDEVLARRPALADFNTRQEKASFACATAGRLNDENIALKRQLTAAIASRDAALAASEQARAEAIEEAAKVADTALKDEEYVHAAFRCVQIAADIRLLAAEKAQKTADDKAGD